MADVKATCPSCGHVCTISEHVEASHTPCPKCNQPVPVPAIQRDSKLSLKKAGKKDFLVETPEVTAVNPHVAADAGLGPRGMDRVHISRTRVSYPKALVMWFAFLLVGSILLGMQYGFEKYPQYDFLITYYIWARAAVAILSVIVLLLTAFEDNLFQGLFCLLVPPYAVYYVFARADSYFLRGAFLALIVSMSAEIYFLGQQAAWLQMQEALYEYIDRGHELIDRAGEAPVY
jgi:hypothetical protein